jgi:hypothetical protein
MEKRSYGSGEGEEKMSEKLSDFIKGKRGLYWDNFYEYILRGVEDLESETQRLKEQINIDNKLTLKLNERHAEKVKILESENKVLMTRCDAMQDVLDQVKKEDSLEKLKIAESRLTRAQGLIHDLCRGYSCGCFESLKINNDVPDDYCSNDCPVKRLGEILK